MDKHVDQESPAPALRQIPSEKQRRAQPQAPPPGEGRASADAHTPAPGRALTRPSARKAGLSYKFQRLREKLRQAVASRELSGKLPGERTLAKRFHVNAKTLSKALTDLAAEGVLDRSIGRGTYVKGSAPTASTHARWLLLCDPEQTASCLVQCLREANPDAQVLTTLAEVRPSFLNGFSAVIDLAPNTPEAFLRDLVVRNVPVVALGREPKIISTHAVLVDVDLGVSRVGRDLLLGGHRRLGAIEPAGATALSRALRQAAARCAPEATVDAATSDEIAALIEHGVTALVCNSSRSARAVRRQLDRLGAAGAAASVAWAGPSLAAVGSCCERPGCGYAASGYFVRCDRLAEAAVGLLRDAASARPATLWLAGEFLDRGTLAAAGDSSASGDRPLPSGRTPC